MELLSEIKSLNLVCEYLIKSSLVLGFALILVFFYRKRSASLRHFLLSFSLISLLLIPFISSFTAGWETSLLPTWQTQKSFSSLSNRAAENIGVPLQGKHEDLKNRGKNLQHLKGVKTSRANRGSLLTVATSKKNMLGISLVILWFLGLIFLLLRIFLGLYGVYRLTQQGEIISDSPWQQMLQSLLKAIRLKRKIGLLSHKKVMVPFT